MTKFASFFVCVLLAVTSGCLAEFENPPPKECVLKAPDLMGNYFSKSEEKTYEISVTATSDADLPLKINLSAGAFALAEPLELHFCVYKIGGREYVFAKDLKNGTFKQFMVFRMSRDKQRITLKPAVVTFFTKNPDTLPKTTVEQPVKGDGFQFPRVKSEATSGQLKAFFEAYGEDESLFSKRLSPKLILHRRP